MAVLAVEELQVDYLRKGRRLKVLAGVSLTVEEGRTLALVGESGCGKSVLALTVMGLLPEGFEPSGGRVVLDGLELLGLPPARRRGVRGSKAAMIFQDPMTALNPVMTVGEQVGEALRLHQGLSRRAAKARTAEMLAEVGVPEAEKRVGAYPHQFSGGLRQRVMIVMALAARPRLLIADEPTTALDATVQAQIFDLLKDLQKRAGTAVLFITHDLEAAATMAEETAVLYAGRCLEAGRTEDVLARPLHPYTRGLTACRPRLIVGPAAQDGGRPAPLAEIPGVVPPLGAAPDFCPFAERCRLRSPRCRSGRPGRIELADGHWAVCDGKEAADD
ncbi:MAG: ABC transporter ATP-binding protein [Deltaproteobacteria bacterium]|jgi:peptide/nickel transport system ATP-binding protein|nr:ABC transporter ATP-binding protein [Deltaproteobacteria bacterium]